MEKEVKRLAQEWFDQAEAELKGAKVLFESGLFEQTCFNSHQAIEFALKSLILLENGKPDFGHNLRILSRKIGATKDIEKKSTFLNGAYQDSRYVDKHGEAPSKIYTYDIAKQHIKYAEEVLRWIIKKKELLMK